MVFGDLGLAGLLLALELRLGLALALELRLGLVESVELRLLEVLVGLRDVARGLLAARLGFRGLDAAERDVREILS